jgi:anti-sigma regulatory factor (Ser/Thr protein kinase)
MTGLGEIPVGEYTHDMLVHDGADEQYVEGATTFVQRGLESGGQVLVHGSPERVDLLRATLGTHERLDYGLDADLYQSPMSTLFAYQRTMATAREPLELWAFGSVLFGPDASGHEAWVRYEAAVNEALRPYVFHGLCTYDALALPADTIAAARVTHPVVGAGAARATSLEYQSPEEYLAHGGVGVPAAPAGPPRTVAALRSVDDLREARLLLHETAVSSTALATSVIDEFAGAVNEVLTNALLHGRAPVRLWVWADSSSLTCEVTDTGPGPDNPLAGYRYPAPDGPRGLWTARQLCGGLYIGTNADGGCSVMLTTG